MTAGMIRLLTGAQARWDGIDPTDPDGSIPQRIYFANHTSNLDAPVIWASLPTPLRLRTRPVAAMDYWLGSPTRRYFSQKVFNCILIERKKVTARTNPLGAMEQALDEGSSLILFPEGMRSMDDDGQMNEFKPGLWHLARHRPNVQLVPVYLENLNRIMPKGDLLIVPLLAAVTFGAPIHPEEGEEKAAFLTRAREAVAELALRGEA